jgi:trehalose 6-phosphate synthase
MDGRRIVRTPEQSELRLRSNSPQDKRRNQMIESGNRLVLLANRLPVGLNQGRDGWNARTSTGGLVTALGPVLKNRGGLWIGWPGVIDADETELRDALSLGSRSAGFELKAVHLTANEIERYYYGFSNEIIWPLFHDLQSHCNFDPSFWRGYLDVNRKFAEVVLKSTDPSDYIWVHDYHLMNVAKELRVDGTGRRVGFFLHIPFPSLDIFLKLPWRFEILHALLTYDLVGFQTLRDRRNFLQCIRALVKGAVVRGKGQVMRIVYEGREIRVGSFPISIDFKEFAELAASNEVAEKAWYIHEDLPNRHIILGIDRLDYTKGIPNRLAAFRNVLVRYPELHGKVTLVQVVVPSREEIPEYYGLKTEIEQMVGEINGQFTLTDWVPIHYIYRRLSRIELLAYYRTAEIVLITPLKDGMNLVAKEYCASNLEENGVVILSEFVGAAAQLQKGALLVNPYDIEGVADAIHRGYTMSREERRQRMRRLRGSVRRQGIFWWVDSFLRAAIARDLQDFPLLDDYFPEDDHPNSRAS